jgi:protein gp37
MALRLERMTGATGDKYEGTAKRARDGRPVFVGRINLDYDALELPKRWRKGRLVFVNSMSDLFHKDVPLDFIQAVFRVMNDCPQHQFQVLTKRPERARELAGELSWSPNVWIGTSVENMMYCWRIKELAAIRQATIRFLSCEPLIGPIPRLPLKGIHWVIVGGESGPGARPMESAWVEQIRDQCVERCVAFFFKQWGGVRKHETGRELHGQLWNELPTRGADGTSQLERSRCKSRAG